MSSEPARVISRHETITERHDGNLAVVDGGHLELAGLASGMVVVDRGGRLVLSGVAMSVVVKSGGVASLKGMVAGVLIVEDGGRAEAAGIVFGPVELRETGILLRRAGARIQGQLVAPPGDSEPL